MRQLECPFEADALSAAIQGRWPNQIDSELHAHITQCAICSDVLTVARALDAEHEIARQHVAVPDSGRVWWLAQLRARREAAQTAARPITAAQVVAFASVVALLGACFGATSLWFQDGLRTAATALRNIDANLLIEHGTLLAAMLVIVILVPAVVYFAVGKD